MEYHKLTIEEQINNLLNEISQYKNENEIDKFMLLMNNINSLQDIYYILNGKGLDINIEACDKDLLHLSKTKHTIYKSRFVRNFNKNKDLYFLLADSIIDFYSKSYYINSNLEYTDIISKEECNEIVNAFYNSIGFDSKTIVKEIYNNHTIHYIGDQLGFYGGLSYATLPLKNSYILCRNIHNIERVITTVHEIAHVILYHKYLPNMDEFHRLFYSKYSEFLPYIMERLLIDYLLKNHMHIKDCYINLNRRYMDLYNYANETKFETFIPDIKINCHGFCLKNKEEIKKILVKEGFNLEEIEMFCGSDINIYYPINYIYSMIIGSKLLLDYQNHPKKVLKELDEFIKLTIIKNNDQIINSVGFDEHTLLRFKALRKEIIDNQQKCLHLFK